MLIPRRDNLNEAIRAGNFTIDLTQNISGGFDLPRPDYIKELEAWRAKCPRINDISHGNGHCERCDGSWHFPTGGVKWAHRTDWRDPPAHRAGAEDVYPAGETFLDPIADSGGVLPPLQDSGETLAPKGRLSKRGNIFDLPKQEFGYGVSGDEVADKIYENVQNYESLAIVCETSDDTIEGTSGQRLRVQESPVMSDYIRDLLRMSGGDALGGRNKLDIPAEIMDALAGDTAQEALSKERVLEEMRRKENGKHLGGDYVSLDLMLEMEKADVDKFIEHARKKIIRRSKTTRKGCCLKIGGVLDQLMGPAGDEYADQKGPEDRGQEDPIGEDAEVNLIGFIAEEFTIREHSEDCPLREALEQDLSEQEKWVQRSIKRPNSLRKHFDLREGDAIPVEEAVEDRNRLRGRIDAGRDLSLEESKLLNRLEAFLRVKLDEAAHTGAVGDMSPATYDDSHKTRGDNAKYPTELKPVKQGANYDAGEPTAPGSMKGERYMKGKDPIGEGEEAEARGKALRSAGWRARAKAADDAIARNKSKNKERDEDARTARGLPRNPNDWQEYHEGLDHGAAQISETASALSSFMEAAKHTGSVGDLNPALYDGSKKTRSDNADYPTALKPAGKGGGYDAGKPKSRKSVDTHSKHRYDKGADPIGEGSDQFGGWTMHRDDAKREGLRQHFARDAERDLHRSKEETGRDLRRVHDAHVQKVDPLKQHAQQAPKGKRKFSYLPKGQQMDDVDYVGPQISETAMALSNFMEAAKHTGAVGDMNKTPYWGETKTRDDNKKDFVKTGQDRAKGERSKGDWDPANKGESKPRYEKGADPVGGATPKQLKRP